MVGERHERQMDRGLGDNAAPRLSEIFYSSGVFGENSAGTDASIEDLVLGLRPQDRLSAAAAIRRIVRLHSEEALRRVG